MIIKKTRFKITLFFFMFSFVLFFISIQSQNNNYSSAAEKSFVAINGQLKVEGSQLVNKNNDPIQLKGVAGQMLPWYMENYINYDTMKYMRDNWNINVFRMAMYTDGPNGYISKPEHQYALMKQGIEDSAKLGIYVIVDWHILWNGNPSTYEEQAKDFFDRISKEYANVPNVIYEICNEPNWVSWPTIKQYANNVIPIIRKNSPNAIILVGTPDWCTSITAPVQSPLTFDNIMYVSHFYAGQLKQSQRDKTTSVINSGLPVFVTEWGITDQTGDGDIYLEEAQRWVDYMSEKNISWVAWSLCDNPESSAFLVKGSDYNAKWTDKNFTESGLFFRKILTAGNTPPIKDTIPPVIKLNGSSSATIEKGKVYQDLGATASDNKDGDITSKIAMEGSVNTSAVGTYQLKYNVIDSSGNKAVEEIRIINVVDTTAPIIANTRVTSTTSSSAVINFDLNEMGDCKIAYGSTSALGMNYTDSTLKTSHTATISNLSANTKYYYKITTKDALGNNTVSTNYTFSTLVETVSIPPNGETANILKDVDKDGFKEIWYLDQLNYLRVNTTDKYELMRNLDFKKNSSYLDISNKRVWITGKGFTPIGSLSLPFQGSFNGNGYKIMNIYINRPKEDYVGFFGKIGDSCNIFNTGLENVNIIGNNFVGGFVGGSGFKKSLISSSYVTGKVKAQGSWTGGFVGLSIAKVENCYAEVNVTANSNKSKFIGGFCGESYASILNCYSMGSVKVSSNTNVGGFYGKNNSNVINSYFDKNRSIKNNNLSIAKTSNEMKQQTLYSSWDFKIIWSLKPNINKGYPALKVFKQ